MGEMDEVVHEFLVESYENLDQLDRDFVGLEEDPGNRETLARVFRTIHTIKGTCGFLGFSKLESVTHVGENLLSLLRDGHLRLNEEITNVLLRMVDAVREMLSAIEGSGLEGDQDYSALVSDLGTLTEAGTLGNAAAPDAAPAAAAAEPAEEKVEATTEETVEAVAEEIESASRSSAETPAAASSETPASRPGGLAETTVRVDVGLLDQLMNLVGELVLARNQIVQFASNSTENALTAASQRLNLITTELQERVMKTRMQPIGNIWSRFPRTVRDLSHQCGKKVRLEMEGKETELDKTLIEAIKDPLTHVVRNSVDHGIEDPETRTARGKPEEGVLKLRAYHESGMVNIEITDDGAGIDPVRIRDKAVQKGTITADRAATLTDREVLNLIFAPGLSTAQKVTNVSGRGVGMDVVKTNIEKIGGAVEIQSVLGEGTTLRIKIPLTLAIIPALIVGTARERYAIPQVSLAELVRIPAREGKGGIEFVHGAPVYRLRGRLLPLVDLAGELGMTGLIERVRTGDCPEDMSINIVVLRADGQQFGLAVQTIRDTEEIVVKPLDRHMKDLPLYAGATIMGDGHIALILDIIGLARRSRIVVEGREQEIVEETLESADALKNLTTLLLVRVGGGRIGVHLSDVARLEEIEPSRVEVVGGQSVVQYRGEIMPLIPVSEIVPERRGIAREEVPAEDGVRSNLQVVVYSEGGRSVGLVVDEVLDILDADLSIRKEPSRDFIMYSAVVRDQVTEILDVRRVIQTGDPRRQEEFDAMALGV